MEPGPEWRAAAPESPLAARPNMVVEKNNSSSSIGFRVYGPNRSQNREKWCQLLQGADEEYWKECPWQLSSVSESAE